MGESSARAAPFVLVGGASPFGSALAAALCRAGRSVAIVDQHAPSHRLAALEVDWVRCDVLTDDDIVLPAGDVVLLDSSNPGSPWPWTYALELGIATARILPALAGRRVVVLSSVDVYGAAPPPLSEDTPPELPLSVGAIQAWCAEARRIAAGRCPPWFVAPVCRRLVEADPSGKSGHALAALAREVLVRGVVRDQECTVLRLAETFGYAQPSLISGMVHRAIAGRWLVLQVHGLRQCVSIDDVAQVLLAGVTPGTFNVARPPTSIEKVAGCVARLCGSPAPGVTRNPRAESQSMVETARLTSAGVTLRPLETALAEYVGSVRAESQPLFEPSLRLTVPPRPARPDQLADRQQLALWQGYVKHGNRWSSELNLRLRSVFELGQDDVLLLTTSGTDALRIAVAGVAGPARSGSVAVLPSFTYPATAEAVVHLGYALRFVDVDPQTWTLDVAALNSALLDGRVGVVVCVDTFGNPCDYQGLRAACARAGVPLVADSAGALGSRYAGRALGTQADAHAFSMSFAKVLSAAGAGGAVVFRSGAPRHDYAAWLGSALMDELHAAAALDQLAIFDDLMARRARIAAVYRRAAELLDGMVVQQVREGDHHCYSNWVARVPAREQVARRLAALGIETRDYFRALHLQSVDMDRAHLPVTETLDRETLALPMSSELTEQDAEAVAIGLEIALAEAEQFTAAGRQPAAASPGPPDGRPRQDDAQWSTDLPNRL